MERGWLYYRYKALSDMWGIKSQDETRFGEKKNN